IGVMVIFGMGTMLPTMMDAFQRGIMSMSGQVDVSVTHKTGEAFSTSILNKIQNVPGVAASTGGIERTINLPANFYGQNSTVGSLTVVGIDPKTGTTVRDYTVTQGRFLKTGDGTSAVIMSSLANTLNLKVGDVLRLPTTEGVVKLTIVGLLPGRPTLGNEEVLISLTEAQKLLDMSGQINVVEANLNTKDVTQRKTIIANIEQTLGKGYTMNALSDASTIFASLDAAKAAFNMLGFLTLFMGGFIIFNTFRTIVAERRHDIGMLRAIGASRGTITGLIMTEGLIQGIVGTALGLVAGYALGEIIVVGLGPFYQQYMNVRVTSMVVQPSLVVISIVLGVGVTLFAGLLPAISASKVTPLEVLRPGLVDKTHRISRVATIAGTVMIAGALVGLVTGSFALVAVGGLLFLVGLVLVAPALVKPIARVLSGLIALALARDATGELAQGNITRQPSRSAITASATMIGLAIVVAAGGMMSSMSGSVLGMFQRSMGSDFMLIPPAVAVWKSDLGATGTLADKIRSVPGVGTVTTLRYASSSIPTNGARGTGDIQVSVLGIDPATYKEVSGMDFTEGNGQQAYAALAAGRAIILNGVLATQLGAHAGQT
ncbi:MAG TPA: FtsX-like permease family protein, partial [Anaerolineae bacterium]